MAAGSPTGLRDGRHIDGLSRNCPTKGLDLVPLSPFGRFQGQDMYGWTQLDSYCAPPRAQHPRACPRSPVCVFTNIGQCDFNFWKKSNAVVIDVILKGHAFLFFYQWRFYMEICIHTGPTLLLVPSCNFILAEHHFYSIASKKKRQKLIMLPGRTSVFFLTPSLVRQEW